jgi:hypothetical protein
MGHKEDLDAVMAKYFGKPGEFLVKKALKECGIEDLETESDQKKEEIVDFIVDNFMSTIMSEQKANFTRGELKTAIGVHLAGAVTYVTHN